MYDFVTDWFKDDEMLVICPIETEDCHSSDIRFWLISSYAASLHTRKQFLYPKPEDVTMLCDSIHCQIVDVLR